MTDLFQAIRGMNDILPEQTYRWQRLETLFANCLSQYGYREIRTPMIESTQLFKRSIGDVTDIVEKEMYTFLDLNGDSLTLRPEGTASCIRACLQHSLLYQNAQKLWYSGPMFRHEKPQKGRYRQFFQFGVEAIGIPGVAIELELLAICQRLWQQLGLSGIIQLEINSLGSHSERQMYRQALIEYLEPHYEKLDADSKRRLKNNPLRILDSKNSEVRALIHDAPKLLQFLGQESQEHFDMLCEGLKSLNIPYHVNPLLVRGLDYYGKTVFEWTTNVLGSQGTVCAGGRYDQLVEQLGGASSPAIGFAIGAERLLLLMEQVESQAGMSPSTDIYVMAMGQEAMQQALNLAEFLRNEPFAYSVEVNTQGGSFKSQFKKADKSGARLALILGENEIKEHVVSIKDLRHSGEQKTVPQSELPEHIEVYLA